MKRGRSGRAKRERSTSAGPPPQPLSKRLRGAPSVGDPPPAVASAAAAAPSQVVITGLPAGCSVLELKSRLQQFGPVSRIKIGGSGSGEVTFRSDEAAQAAILASIEPGIGISIGSCKILVVRPGEPPVQERTETAGSPFSRLLRPEPPLRKHGRSNRKLVIQELIASTRSRAELGSDIPSPRSRAELGSDIPSPRAEPDLGSAIPSTRAIADPSKVGREIVAYDDLF